MDTHLVKSFDEELERLNSMVLAMGDLACQQMQAIVKAVELRDAGLATLIIEREPDADRMEHRINNAVLRLLALRQPVAIDLRQVLAALRIANELERILAALRIANELARICDHAENMARRLLTLAESQTTPFHSFIDIARFATTMLKDTIDAYAKRDADLALVVWNRDKDLDEMYSSFFRELLTYMMEDPRRVSASVQTLIMARDIERIGDRNTNIVEMVRFLIGGRPVEEERPKADRTKTMLVGNA